MREIASPLHAARHLLMQDKAWLLFVEIPLSTGAFFRLVRNTRHVAGDGKKWQACTMEIELPEEDAEGSLGDLVVSVPNVSRLPMSYVEVDIGETGRGELLGRTLTCWLQHEDNLDTFEPALSWRHLILAAECDESSARFRCGHPARMQRIPSRVYTRAEFPQLLALGAS